MEIKTKERKGKVCYKTCREKETSCPCENCRYWIDFENDYNCVFNSVYLNGDMTLKQTSERLNLTISEVCQIEKRVLAKMKRIFLKEKGFTL